MLRGNSFIAAMAAIAAIAKAAGLWRILLEESKK